MKPLLRNSLCLLVLGLLWTFPISAQQTNAEGTLLDGAIVLRVRSGAVEWQGRRLPLAEFQQRIAKVGETVTNQKVALLIDDRTTGSQLIEIHNLSTKAGMVVVKIEREQ